MMSRVVALSVLAAASLATADEPAALYIFPAGGQRGTTVDVRIGGMNLRETCWLHWGGAGVTAPPMIFRTRTTWFEGPVIPLPDSQRQEDYPRDYAARLTIAADAELGVRRWRVSTSQGVTPTLPFVVGDEPEIVEQETDGRAIPVAVTTPVTANGRIFPREDVDEWSFSLPRGRTIRAEVHAARIGSGLDAQLEIVDAAGRTLAAAGDTLGADPMIVFTAPSDGMYRARIYDAAYGGLQPYIYRLTLSERPHVLSVFPLGAQRGLATKFELTGVNVPAAPQALAIPADAGEEQRARFDFGGSPTNPIVIATGTYDEELEGANTRALRLPVVLNGRIGAPGECDEWKVALHHGETVDFDLRAGRLGSPLDSVLAVADESGKLLVENDDLNGVESDSFLRFTPPADGDYVLRVAERSKSRGGREFAYRLIAAPTGEPDFRLTLPTDAITVLRGSTTKLKLRIDRLGGFSESVKIAADGLPEGVTLAAAEIAKGRNDLDLIFRATDSAPIVLREVTLRGTAKSREREIGHTATLPAALGEAQRDRLALAVGMPTPFTTVAEFGLPFAPRGSVFFKRFKIERHGYEGTLIVHPAEKQVRHLQGVQGETLLVPAGVDTFDYPIYLPPWMELGRTSRSHITVVGRVDDGTGVMHDVSYTSNHQNEQLSLIVAPGRLNLTLEPNSLVPMVEESDAVRLRLDRDAGLDGEIRVELIVPPHIRGIAADAVTVPAGTNEAVLRIQFAGDAGPFNIPLVVRATHGRGRARHVAEATLEVVE